MKYEAVSDGDLVQPVMRGYRMRCCDCGLTHILDFGIKKNRVQFKVRRDDRATNRYRSRAGIWVERARG